MSYVLQVWESPRPTSLEDADDILGRLLADKVVRTRPRLMALAKALWNQFPSDPRTAPNDPVWVDSSLSRPHDGSPLLTLGIATRYLDVLVPFVAAAATANGLTVYDPQYGTVYLPDGRTFGNLPAPPGEGDASLDRNETRELVVKQLASFMQSHGFQWTPTLDSGAFTTRFEGGGHAISISPALLVQGVDIRIVSSTHFEKVDDVMARLGLAPSGYSFTAMTCGLARLIKKEMPMEAAGWLPGGLNHFRTADRTSLPSTARNVESAMRGALLPILNRVRSIESLWAFALENAGVQEDERGATLNPNAVIVCGWLLGDQRHLDVANARREELAANVERAARWGRTATMEEEQAKFEKFLLDLAALGR